MDSAALDPSSDRPGGPSLPPIEALHTFSAEEDRDYGIGVHLDHRRLDVAASQADPEEVLGLLEGPTDLPRVLAAVLVLPRLLEGRPSLTTRAEKALLKLLTDGRVHKTRVKGRAVAFALVPEVLEAYLALASAKAGADRTRALLDGLLRVLSSTDTAGCAGAFLTRDATESEVPLAEALVAAVADRGRPAATRLAAYESLRCKVQGSQVIDETRKRAAAVLVSALSEPEEDREVQRYAKENLVELDPNAIDRLQRDGHLRTRGVPSIEELLASGSPSVPSTATELTEEQVVGALRSSDVSRVLAAAYLAPEVGRRGGWKAMAESLLPWVGSSATLEVDGRYGRHVLQVGRVASEKLLELAGERVRARDLEAQEIRFEALGVLVDVRPWTRLDGDRASGYARMLRVAAPCELRSFLRDRFRDRDRPPATRYRALSLYGTSLDKEEVRDYGEHALLDPNEEPGFRALLGTTLLKWRPHALDALIDRSQEPWVLRPEAPSDLPVSRPKDKVPSAWLVSSVCAAREQETLRSALGALMDRFRLDRAEDGPQVSASFHALAGCSPAQFLSTLRELTVGSASFPGHQGLAEPLQGMEGPANAAAQLLALLGLPEDRDRIARRGAGSVWVSFAPWTRGGSRLADLTSMMEGKNALGEVWSWIHPYVLAGYGASEAQILRARMLVLLAHDHLGAGRTESARRTFEAALALNPKDPVAARELRRLSD